MIYNIALDYIFYINIVDKEESKTNTKHNTVFVYIVYKNK